MKRIAKNAPAGTMATLLLSSTVYPILDAGLCYGAPGFAAEGSTVEVLETVADRALVRDGRGLHAWIDLEYLAARPQRAAAEYPLFANVE